MTESSGHHHRNHHRESPRNPAVQTLLLSLAHSSNTLVSHYNVAVVHKVAVAKYGVIDAPRGGCEQRKSR